MGWYKAIETNRQEKIKDIYEKNEVIMKLFLNN